METVTAYKSQFCLISSAYSDVTISCRSGAAACGAANPSPRAGPALLNEATTRSRHFLDVRPADGGLRHVQFRSIRPGPTLDSNH
jgi:hypothetical protein